MANDFKNIRINSVSFAAVDDYFVVAYPSANNYLMKKTNFGDPVMTYPFTYEFGVGADESGTNYFLALETDGLNYWTLEVPEDGVLPWIAGTVYSGTLLTGAVDFRSASTEIQRNAFRLVRRWRIENFMFTLKDQAILHPGDTDSYSKVDAFAIEHYHDVLAQATASGSATLKLTTPTACYFHSNDYVTIYNNTTGNYIDRQVASVSDNYTVLLNATVTETVAAGSPVSHVGYMYTFNDDGANSFVGTIEKRSISFYTGPESGIAAATDLVEVDACYESGLYKNIRAAHFCTTSGVSAINNGYHTGYIVYLKNMQLFFKKPARKTPDVGLTYPDGSTGTNAEFTTNDVSMMMYDLLNKDKTAVHHVYDLSSSSTPGTEIAENIYRLQTNATYGDADYTFGTGEYNYVVSVTTPLVTAITLVVEPAVLPADSTSKTNIYATVTDQYGYPINGKTINFSVSGDAYGGTFCNPTIGTCGAGCTINPAPVNTASIETGSQGVGDGKAVVGWQVGSEAGYPLIVATVSQ